ncbi:DsbA family protein [Acidicapsa dinghuensis]|uniref:DsbA family protein n=1 Tax=Acidicapsa dinghuensis TaxID=2218256 RepID=A0ABW1ENS6_9BACT|nr:thioredoxin domain-containing protein [Acidicapsa dinghuensis]
MTSVSFCRRSGANRFRQVASFVFAIGLAAPTASRLMAQTNVPPVPSAPPAATSVEPVFPKTDPSDFTADSPTKEQVEGFLRASWGYDTNRVYEVARILKTDVPGVSNVIVLVGEKGRKETGALQFIVLPDGKHLVAGGQQLEILPFGEHPYAENRTSLVARANGPSSGGASKDLEIVEFADFQCPHCKEAQPTIQKILTDFPNAHFVFENFPLAQHPQAFRSAAYGVCVAKLGGNKAFFDYASAVFEGQAGLATDDGATLTLNSAVTKAGQDPDKVEACSKTPETKATVDASAQLAKDLSVNQTPTLAINGRLVPLGNADYNVLKQMITYHASNDGPAK